MRRSTTFLAWASIAQLALPSAQAQGSSRDPILWIRRVTDLAQFPQLAELQGVEEFLGNQTDDGTWADVDYTAGCDAQRANWPIQEHWLRIIAILSSATGLNPLATTASVSQSSASTDPGLQAGVKGMDWWFDNDYISDDCIGGGGLANGTCPCGTPGLWNGNWFDQVILIPQLVSTSCLLLNYFNTTSLFTNATMAGCERIPARAYDRRDAFIQGVGYLTGANTINVMQNSVSLGLYTYNQSIVEDAYARATGVVTFSDAAKEDGIHQDGSFLQHSGIEYTGNYGKDLINAFVQLEGEAQGTAYAANQTEREAFATMIRGSEWMTFRDRETGQLHWDLTTIGRFIAFPYADLQANSDIHINATNLAAAVCDFDGADDLSDVTSRLLSNETDGMTGSNLLLGNKHLWASDYTVQRRENWIASSKMISSRSKNTEYTNDANPYGYHMDQGTLFSYTTGTEYKDIQAAWDWNLIPGTTTLLDYPKLNSNLTKNLGKKPFVGGVSDGWVGTSVMDWTDPYDRHLSYRKAVFFWDDVVVVTTRDIKLNKSVETNSSLIVTTLTNQAAVGTDDGVWVDGQQVDVRGQGSVEWDSSSETLWYGNRGYKSYTSFHFTLFDGESTGNWSAISTSTAGNQTADIFSAYSILDADTTASSYAWYPHISQEDFAAGNSQTPKLYTDNGTDGVAGYERLSVVFWPNGTQAAHVPMADIAFLWASPSENDTFNLNAADPSIFLFATAPNDDGTQRLAITLAEPTQKLNTTSFDLRVDGWAIRCQAAGGDGCTQAGDGVSFQVELPKDGLAGASVFLGVDVAPCS